MEKIGQLFDGIRCTLANGEFFDKIQNGMSGNRV
ncbi:MAG: hypothetical protein ACD_75C00855G0001 [uncultured bacterium]|nr:MAG: hypothetical protein ACD_75C00855G0001 [uncultured bacterium]